MSDSQTGYALIAHHKQRRRKSIKKSSNEKLVNMEIQNRSHDQM